MKKVYLSFIAAMALGASAATPQALSLIHI